MDFVGCAHQVLVVLPAGGCERSTNLIGMRTRGRGVSKSFE